MDTGPIREFANTLADTMLGNPTRLERIAARELHRCCQAIEDLQESLGEYIDLPDVHTAEELDAVYQKCLKALGRECRGGGPAQAVGVPGGEDC